MIVTERRQIHPLEGRPTWHWTMATVSQAPAIVASHTALAGTMRWTFGLSVSSRPRHRVR